MQRQVLEARILDLVGRVVDGGKVEDALTECKRQFPDDPSKAARQVGALANAAQGRDVLWLIGVDEDGHVVVPLDETELANWWRSVQSKFDGAAPEMVENMLVQTPSGDVLALQFSTNRAPYVVKVPQPSAYVHREVPWRSGTSTDSATRDQLLRLLVETTFTPEIELIDPSLRLIDDELRFKAELFVSMSTTSQHPPLLPRRQWSVVARSGDMDAQGLRMNTTLSRHVTRMGGRMIRSGGSLEFTPDEYDPESPYGVYVRHAGLIVTGSDSVVIKASASVEGMSLENVDYFDVDVAFPIDRSDRVARGQCKLRRQPDNGGDDSRNFKGRWTLDD